MSVGETDFKQVDPENSRHQTRLNIDFESLSVVVHRNSANARERSRTTSVNVAFSELRTCIPTEPRDRKLSKVETLRLACSYIGHLANVIRARSEGDYGGRVCQRYGSIFEHKSERPVPRQICTFCLTDSRRSYQFLCSKSKENSAIIGLRMQENLSIYSHPTAYPRRCSHSELKNQDTEKFGREIRHQCLVKEEPEEPI